ncbi:MAG TPA: rhamnogalacturonan acetylesterase [Opitutaceae bacterium]|nr:rhamnogalacturonan acetylesterase [Opitutaceae bacterium]
MPTSLRSFLVLALPGLLASAGLLAADAAAPAAPPAPTSFKFDFGARAAPGFTAVTPATVYSKDSGAGFDLGTAPTVVEQGGGDPQHDGFVTSDKPFFFSVKVPEGNYRVTVTLGDARADSVTTVKSESRRLMLERVRTPAGKFETRTFIANVRNAKVPPPPLNAPGNDHVELNNREDGPNGLVLHWDDKLTLEFSDTHPSLCALEIDRVDDLPTVFVIGDSTVTDQPREPTTSWGQMLPRFFKPDVAVANHAESGETMKSFLTELRFDKVMSLIKKGDYLIMQFGHNDSKASWPQTYVEANTTYKAYLKTFIAEARRRGVTPIIVNPMQRHQFDGAKVHNTHGDYPAAVRAVAKEEGVAFIDLTADSVAFLEALGPEKSWVAQSGGRDATHHSAYGAYELAKCIVQGIRDNKLELAKSIVDDFQPFDPAHPDDPAKFDLPASPGRQTQAPRGN